MNIEDFVIDLKNFTYDRSVLLDIFEQARPYGRVKGLKWKTYTGKPRSPDQATNLVIQHGNHMMLDPTKDDLSYDLMQHDYIKNLVGRLNFTHEINPGNVDIIWNRKGFVFEPHVDHYAKATMMWNILPEDGGVPVDFYSKDKVQYELGQALGFEKILTDEDIIHTHNYGTNYPTIFNSHWPHGVRTVTNVERVYLRLRINEPYESILEKHQNGTLVIG